MDKKIRNWFCRRFETRIVFFSGNSNGILKLTGSFERGKGRVNLYPTEEGGEILYKRIIFRRTRRETSRFCHISRMQRFTIISNPEEASGTGRHSYHQSYSFWRYLFHRSQSVPTGHIFTHADNQVVFIQESTYFKRKVEGMKKVNFSGNQICYYPRTEGLFGLLT